jgi:tRNA nucleotidyltransferase/poly(A) polymerase
MKSFAQHIGSNFLFESRLDAALPKKVRDVITSGGGKIYQVGGAVRDALLGKISKDLDLLVTGVDLSELEKRLKPYGKVNLVGKSFGILKFKPEGSDEELDISVPRIDSKSTGKGHKEFEIKLGKGITLQQDQMRRDFWMNALSKDVETGEIHDVKGKGQLSIANKEVEMISPRAFQEDPLRMLRAIQFAARFDFTIEKKTFKEIQKNAKSIKTIAAERFQEEFRKMFEKSTNVTVGIDYLFSTGIMKHIFSKAKRNDIDSKIVNRLDKTAFPAFLAMMLGPNYGAETAAKIAMSKMRISKDDASAISAVLKYKERGFDMDDVSFVEMIRKDIILSGNVLKNLNAFAIAAGASKRFVPSDRLATLKKKKVPYTLKQLKVSGRDLISIGLKGKTVGEALQHLLYFAIRTGKNDKGSLMKEINRKYTGGRK